MLLKSDFAVAPTRDPRPTDKIGKDAWNPSYKEPKAPRHHRHDRGDRRQASQCLDENGGGQGDYLRCVANIIRTKRTIGIAARTT